MTRWEDSEVDSSEYGASGLIDKFQEYVNLEKFELEKQKVHNAQCEKVQSFLKSTGVKLSIIEGGILVGLTSAFLMLWIANT